MTPRATPTAGQPECINPLLVSGRLPSDDTYINASDKDRVLGDQFNFEVRPDNDADRRGLVQFDLSDIPGGVTIDSATLYLYSLDNKSEQITYLYRITSPWTEETATWNAPWSLPGGDFDSSAAYGLFIPGKQNCYISLDLTVLVQDWVDGTHPNYGVLLYSTGPNHIIKYSAKEGGLNLEPRLAVTYTTGVQARSQDTNLIQALFNWLFRLDRLMKPG